MPEHQIPPHKLAPGLRIREAEVAERKAKMLLGIIKLKRYHGLSDEELEQVMKMACELSK
ncbi:hypothetical protein CKY04_21725 [Photorhabdus sp. S8-52]|nr:hypothetical protein CKY03_21670 [Photorhabdus sp. S9-53]RAW97251.1 hypothetical protein CKY04_21725 [Photorhabdus sp. S8-52]RAW97614.1 hypothetical protein CKY05_13450 [Photorhabdus sp. S10-54]